MGNTLFNPRQHNVQEVENTGAFFMDEEYTDFLSRKNKILSKIAFTNLNSESIESVEDKTFGNKEYLYMVKNFVNYYNENNKYKMNFLKKSIKRKYLVNGNKYLYIMLFFVEYEDGIMITPRAQNIALFYIVPKKELYFNVKNIMNTHIFSEWSTSDVVFGNEEEFLKKRFIDIFSDAAEVKYLFDQNVIDDIVNNKEYVSKFTYQRGIPERVFKGTDPSYVTITEPSQLKIGGKCLNKTDNTISFGACGSKSDKFITGNHQIKHVDSGMCVSYHKDGEISLVPCESITSCGTDGLDNCNKLRIRKYGGLEITGKDDLCLDNDLNSKKCFTVNKIEL